MLPRPHGDASLSMRWTIRPILCPWMSRGYRGGVGLKGAGHLWSRSVPEGTFRVYTRNEVFDGGEASYPRGTGLVSESPSRVYTRCVILDGGGSFQPPDARNRVPCVHTLRDFRHGRSPLGALSQLAGRLASLLPECASRVYARGSISGTAKPDGREMKSRGARATRTRSRGKVPPLIRHPCPASGPTSMSPLLALPSWESMDSRACAG